MSAFARITDSTRTWRHVRKVPDSDICGENGRKAARAHSGNPALRRPSIRRCAFD